MISEITQQKDKTEILYPLSHPQLRILYSEELYPDTSMQSVVSSYHLEGDFSVKSLSEAINLVIQDNLELRLRIKKEGFEIKQYVHPFEHCHIEYHDFEGQEEVFQEWLNTQCQIPIPLYNSPLIEFAIYKNPQARNCIFFKGHHILKDGATRRIIIEKILAAYDRLESNSAYSAEQPSYLDYLKGETKYKDSEAFEKDRSFWLNKHQSFGTTSPLFPKHRGKVSSESKRKEFRFSKEEIQAFSQCIGESDTSLFKLFMLNFRLFLAFTYTIFHRISDQKQISIGTTLHGRSSPLYKDIMGMFVNMLPFYLSTKEDASFEELLDSIKQELKENISHQDYPYDLLIKDIRESFGQQQSSELFELVLNYQNSRYPSEVVKVDWHHSGYDNYPLILNLTENNIDGSLLLEIDYRSSVFMDAEIELLFLFYKAVIKQVSANPRISLSSIELYSEEVKSYLEKANFLLPPPSPSHGPILAYCIAQHFQSNSHSKKDFELILHQKEKEQKYWKEVLSTHQMSFFPPHSSSTIYKTYTYSLSPKHAEKLISISNGSDQRLQIILSACVLLLFHKYTEQDKLSIGSTLFSQNTYEKLVNRCLPIFCEFSPNDSYKDMLIKVIQNVNQAIGQQNYPIEHMLRQEADPKQDGSSQERFFDVKVYLENVQKIELAPLSFSSLLFAFSRKDQEIHAKIAYDSQLLDQSKLRKFLENLDTIFEQLITDIHAPIEELVLPHFKRSSFCLAGENSVAVSCAKLLLARKHKISSIISRNPELQKIAAQHEIMCIDPFEEEFDTHFEGQTYDYFLNLEDQGNLLPFKLAGKILKYHDSLLPQYPGFYATSRAILNQDHVHGITWYLSDKEGENREVCKQLSFEVAPHETSYSLNLKCIGYVLQSFEFLIEDLESNSLSTKPIFISKEKAQDKNCTPYAAGMLSFDAPAKEIIALIRALNFENYDNPISTAKISIENHLFIPDSMRILPDRSREEAATVLLIEPDHIVIATSTYDVEIQSYQSISPGNLEDLLFYEGMSLQLPAEDLAIIDKINRHIAPYENFWLEKFRNLSQISLGLPINTDWNKDEYASCWTSVDLPTHDSFFATNSSYDPDLNLLLFAAFLYRISGNPDFIIQYQDQALFELCGAYSHIFAEYVPLKIETDAQMIFEDFHEKVGAELKAVREAGSFQKDLFYRYKKLNAIHATGNIFSNIKVTLTDRDFETISSEDADLLHLLIHTQKPQMSLRSHEQNIRKDLIEKLANQFQNFMLDLGENRHKQISKTYLDKVEERERILLGFNDSAQAFSEDKTLHQLFEEAVILHGDKTALALGEKTLTYAELNQKANQTAHALIQKGLRQGESVAIMTERSFEMIIAVMGVVKAGGVYIPIDLGQPENRILQILNSVQAHFSLIYKIDPAILEAIYQGNSSLTCILDLDEDKSHLYDEKLPIMDWGEISRCSSQNPGPISGPDDLAYVIHTSGSTGTPKGVVVKHRSAINTLEWVNKTYKLGPKDKLLFITSIGFDLSVYDIFGVLATGASLQIALKEQIQDPRELTQMISKYGISIWDSTPGTLNQCVPYLEEIAAQSQQFRLAMLSGDWIPLSLPPSLQHLFKDIHVLSMGGATEASIWSNYFDVYELDPSWKSVPYGKPIQNCKYYIFDKHMNICPTYVEGDLYIGGSCVTEGYLNKVELTREKFIDNPYFPGEKIYKTGDRARWFEDGNMEFLGRVDHQIKLRGFRIELGEIESQMLKFPGISTAIALVKTFREEDKRLMAYFTSTESVPLSELKTHLRNNLPDYMLPSQLIQVDKIPITPIGKVDREALLAIKASQEKQENLELDQLSDVGKQIVRIWEEALGIGQIQLDDNFFELGGHSFLVIQVSNMMQDSFGREPKFVSFTNINLREFIKNFEEEL